MFGPRAHAAGLLYAGSACAGSVLLVLVWQTPVGTAIEEATGFRPAILGSAIGSLAITLLPEPPAALIAPPAPPAPPAAAASTAVPVTTMPPAATSTLAPAVAPSAPNPLAFDAPPAEEAASSISVTAPEPTTAPPVATIIPAPAAPTRAPLPSATAQVAGPTALPAPAASAAPTPPPTSVVPLIDGPDDPGISVPIDPSPVAGLAGEVVRAAESVIGAAEGLAQDASPTVVSLLGSRGQPLNPDRRDGSGATGQPQPTSAVQAIDTAVGSLQRLPDTGAASLAVAATATAAPTALPATATPQPGPTTQPTATAQTSAAQQVQSSASGASAQVVEQAPKVTGGAADAVGAVGASVPKLP